MPHHGRTAVVAESGNQLTVPAPSSCQGAVPRHATCPLPAPPHFLSPLSLQVPSVPSASSSLRPTAGAYPGTSGARPTPGSPTPASPGLWTAGSVSMGTTWRRWGTPPALLYPSPLLPTAPCWTPCWRRLPAAPSALWPPAWPGGMVPWSAPSGRLPCGAMTVPCCATPALPQLRGAPSFPWRPLPLLGSTLCALGPPRWPSTPCPSSWSTPGEVLLHLLGASPLPAPLSSLPAPLFAVRPPSSATVCPTGSTACSRLAPPWVSLQDYLYRPLGPSGTVFQEATLGSTAVYQLLTRRLRTFQLYQGESVHSFRRGPCRLATSRGSPLLTWHVVPRLPLTASSGCIWTLVPTARAARGGRGPWSWGTTATPALMGVTRCGCLPVLPLP